MSELAWWAYRHINGTIQVKRYFSREDLTEADESPFVSERTDVFHADDREAAEEKAKELLTIRKDN